MIKKATFLKGVSFLFLVKLFNFLKKNIVLLKKSISTKSYFYSLAIDVVSLILFVGVLALFLMPAYSALTDIETILSGVTDASQITAQMTETIQNAYSIMVIFSILAIFASLFVLSATRLFFWRRLLKSRSPSERFSKKVFRYLRHHLGALIFFILFVVIPGIIVASNVSSVADLIMSRERLRAFTIFIVVIMLFYLHLHVLFNYIFAKTSKLFFSFKNSFSLGITQFNYFIVPYLIIGIFSYAVSYLLFLSRYILSLRFVVIAHIVFFVLAIPVYRLFISKLISILYKKYLSKD